MTVRFSAGDPEPEPQGPAQATQALYDMVVADVHAAILKIQAGEIEAKSATQAVREMRQLLLLVLEERSKVAKLSKQHEGIAYDYALDLDAARAEIGSRLARLRDAGDS